MNNLDWAGIVSIVALLGIVWKGGQILGSFRTSLDLWAKRTEDQGKHLDKQAELLARVSTQLDGLEARVSRLEDSRA